MPGDGLAQLTALPVVPECHTHTWVAIHVFPRRKRREPTFKHQGNVFEVENLKPGKFRGGRRESRLMAYRLKKSSNAVLRPA
jgi:hypothetical protein